MKEIFFEEKKGQGVGRGGEEECKETKTYESKCINLDPLEMVFRKTS